MATELHVGNAISAMCVVQRQSWQCLECKEWFCMENPADAKNKKRRYSLVQSTVDNKLVEFQNACFHNKHREAWEVDK